MTKCVVLFSGVSCCYGNLLHCHGDQGLQYIHSMGLVHLDIKPDNVFLCLPECNGSENEAPMPSDSTETTRIDPTSQENGPTYKIGEFSAAHVHMCYIHVRTCMYVCMYVCTYVLGVCRYACGEGVMSRWWQFYHH